MLYNYLVTALRNLARHRLYGFINIAGLAVGLACAIFIVLFLRDELSWDRWIPGSANIWRVETTYTYPGSAPERDAAAPFPLGAAMRADIPEVQAATRAVHEDVTLKSGDRQFPETLAYVDPDFFTVIRLPLLWGDAARVFDDPESVVLSQSMARKYFGAADPVGRTLTVEGKHPLTVTGILRDPPHNSDFQEQIFVSNKSKSDEFGDKQDWFSPDSFTFVRLLAGSKPADVIAKTRAIFRRDADPTIFSKTTLTGDRIVQTRLVQLSDIHLVGDEGGDHNAGSWTTVYGFSAIAALILAIAGFNFTNLATARAMTRAREMSLRKVVGAKRVQLIVQFLAESVLTALLALTLALTALEILLPAYDGFLDRPIAFSWLPDWPLGLSFAGGAVVAGLLAGIYPALVLSGFRPAAMLHGGAKGQGASGLLRTGLVVLQFAISIGLGVAAIVVFAQIDYARRIDLGFNRDNMVVLDGADVLTEATRQSLMHRLASNPDILGVTESSAAPFGGLYQGIDANLPGGLFVGIAIFIACLGLFGLAAFSAERRTKEIGVRKVFGARTRDVVRLLLWQFSIPVLIANVIAWPVAWYYLHNWLESYAYRITLSPLYFLA
ncbi:MAG: ABC transporter permease, partial [Rhizomicrobium sp.]